MSRIGTLARRTFLIGSAAIAGGVAFGVYAVRKPHDNPLADGLATDAATFNPWVRVAPDKITLITPHADIGQGVVHMQATLIAEEMDLDFGQFETEFGQPSAAYYNRAMSDEAGVALSAITPLPANLAAGALDSVFKLIGLQGTGGSTSTPDSFDKLREAGAVARETLKAAAAEETGVPVAELKTKSGAVILPDGTEILYTALAARAATIAPVTDVTLRDPSEWRLIGKAAQRADIVAKSTGRQSYGIDLKVDGMVKHRGPHEPAPQRRRLLRRERGSTDARGQRRGRGHQRSRGSGRQHMARDQGRRGYRRGVGTGGLPCGTGRPLGRHRRQFWQGRPIQRPVAQ